MFNPRAAYQTLLESGKLDAMLADAAALTGKTAAAATAPDVDAVVASASAVAADLRKMAADAASRRAEKVATLIHLGRVATRLLA